VRERTLVKELGKFTPYVRKKECRRKPAAVKRPNRLFTKNTVLCKLVMDLVKRSESGTLIRGRHHLWSQATGSEGESGELRRWASGELYRRNA